MAKLCEVIAVEKEVSGKALAELTRLYKLPEDLFSGFHRSYAPLVDSDPDVAPPESKRVQQTAPEVVQQVQEALGKLLDVAAARDYGNLLATGDIVLDGQALLERVPVPFLLWLEKKLQDPLRAILDKLPVLDPAREWQWDSVAGLWKTEPLTKLRTRKVQEPLVLLQPTPEHPGQAQVITKDVPVGHWHETFHSGAVPEHVKRELLRRVDRLSQAVKQARERANLTEAPAVAASGRLLGFVFSGVNFGG